MSTAAPTRGGYASSAASSAAVSVTSSAGALSVAGLALAGSGADSALDTRRATAFNGLDVAVQRFYSVDPSVPPNPVRVAPVFALNYGDFADSDVREGLNIALSHYPTGPSLTASPIFFGLANASPPSVDG